MSWFETVGTAEIESARARLRGVVARTPVVRCAAATADKQVHLKLENLQPAGSFKLRPIGNAMLIQAPGRAWRRSSHVQLRQQCARDGMDGEAPRYYCDGRVPEGAAESKLSAVARS